MRSIVFTIGIVVLGITACLPKVYKEEYPVDFGIYETSQNLILPDSTKIQLFELGIQIADSTQNPIIGYSVTNERVWQDSLSGIVLDNNIRMAVIKETDVTGGLFAVVALKDSVYISNSDIKEAIGYQDRVEIHFNMAGAVKWAKMTERNTGRQVAFLLDGEIFSMPFIAAAIKNGEALITGLNEEEATRIASALNGE